MGSGATGSGAAGPGAAGSAVKPPRRWTPLDVFYFIGVILKGIDGAIELLVGLVLLLAPSIPHLALSAIAAEAGEGSGPIRVFIAGYVENLDDRLAQSGLGFLMAFLIVHGVVKLVLVYCLLRRLHRAYPYALAVLILFLAYQVYTALVSPTIGLILLTVLDAVIIVLVYREYREIKPKVAASSVAGPRTH